MGLMTRLALAALVVAGFPADARSAECSSIGIHFLGDFWMPGQTARPARDYLVDIWRSAGNPSYSRVYVEMEKDVYRPGMAFEFIRRDAAGEVVMKEKMSLVPRITEDARFLDFVQIDLPRLERMAARLDDEAANRGGTLLLSIRLRRDTICTKEIRIELDGP